VISLAILAVIIGLSFAPPALRRAVFKTLSSVFALLTGVLFLTWLMGSRSQPRRRW
jgi:hypothetical protein